MENVLLGHDQEKMCYQIITFLILQKKDNVIFKIILFYTFKHLKRRFSKHV